MSGELSDSEGEDPRQLEYYYSPTSQREEEERAAAQTAEELKACEQERKAALSLRLESHRREFCAFVKAREVL